MQKKLKKEVGPLEVIERGCKLSTLWKVKHFRHRGGRRSSTGGENIIGILRFDANVKRT